MYVLKSDSTKNLLLAATLGAVAAYFISQIPIDIIYGQIYYPKIKRELQSNPNQNVNDTGGLVLEERVK